MLREADSFLRGVTCGKKRGGRQPKWVQQRCSAALITKASEASWSYSCDSKVSFDRVQRRVFSYLAALHFPILER